MNKNIDAAVRSLGYDEITREIKRTMRRSAKDAVQLGYMLRRVMEGRLYLEQFDDFGSYLNQELHMDYTMASRFMKINRKYSVGGDSMEISTQYEDYSQGLLIEMLNMPPELEAKVTPDTTVSQAREMKRASKPKPPDQVSQAPDIIEGGVQGDHASRFRSCDVATCTAFYNCQRSLWMHDSNPGRELPGYRIYQSGKGV